METITLFFNALIDLSNAMAPYILFGLLFAGIMHELIPETIVTKHLGKDNIGSVIKATLFGVPLPVCSCGVIPIATSIKKSGASNGATLSFLISTPITGVDSILATFGMFGWVFTLYRVLTSMVIAMVAGILSNFYGEREKVQTSAFSVVPPTTDHEESTSCCSSSSCSNTEKSSAFSIIKAIKYGFGTLLDDIAKPLLWGLLLGAIITVLIPENLSQILLEYSWISYIIVIAIAIPMYVCATASLPIAAGLMLSGVSAGAAFVFLTAGPATNTVTIGVVKKMLGTKSLAIYLGTITGGSILFGIGLDWLIASNGIIIKDMIHIHEEASIIDIASSIVLWGLVGYFIIKTWLPKKETASCCHNS